MTDIVRNSRDRSLGAITVVLSCALLILAFVACAPQQAAAYGYEDQKRAESLSFTVYYEADGGFVSNADVLIYRVAEVLEDGTLVPAEEFADYPINWNVTDSSSARDLANTLEGYILLAANSPSVYSLGESGSSPMILPVDVGVTDENGVALFPTESVSLDEGYYLVTASSKSDDETLVEASPVLLQLPYSYDSGEVDYNPAVQLKVRSFSLSRPVTIDVSKVWKAEEAEGASEVEQAARPQAVGVTLLCDGAVYDSAELNEENGWHYAWEDLSSRCSWSVVEETVPDGYKVSVSEDGSFVVVTNTYEAPEEHLPDTPAGEEEKDEPGESPEGSQKKEKLPQTGLLWWPVPLLLVAGVACMIIGVVGRRKDV